MRFSIIFPAMLFLGQVAFAEPFISEFMASNHAGLQDEDGSYSDWMEIHNPDATPVELGGWSLTDNAGNLRKWVFPAGVTIPAGGYLVVFASDKNRAIAGQPLHTNFAISAGGEYLGLVKPDGVTKASEFAPSFPPQFEDVAYGISSTVMETKLTQQGSPAKALVPTNNALGATWRAAGFNDSGWTSGPLAAGFFNYNATSDPDLSSTLGLDVKTQMGGQQRSAYVRVPFTVVDPSKVQKMVLRVRFDDGFAAFINGEPATSSRSPTVEALAYDSLATGQHNPTNFEEFEINPSIDDLQAGTNVLAVQMMNSSPGSSDAYVLPELIVTGDAGGEPAVGYFTQATPGAQNVGPQGVLLPQTVTASRASGPFTTAFNLTLGGTVSGQQIRYVIAAPSSSGADLPEPTSTSNLYTGPIAINANRMIRAAIFNASNGQKGLTRTLQYQQLETGGGNNTSSFTSTLPILVADDHGAGQPVDSGGGTYTTAMFYVFPTAGGTASLNSTPAVATRAGLRVRGRSSAGFPKKSYGMETWTETNEDFKMELLGLASESDWILNGPWNFDDTYIHNAFVYELSRQLGRWAPRTKFVEMFANTNGGKLDYTDYAGVYVLTEKIESGGDRLDIDEVGPGDNAGDAVTGGYIFKIDSADGDEVSWHTNRGIPNTESGQSLVIVEPDADVSTPEQVNYLKGYIQTFEDALFTDAAGGFATRNYRKYLDVASLVDIHIMVSLAYNVDALRLSAFYYKDRNSKIRLGPLWDFDRALGSDDGRDSNPRSWANIDYFFDRDWLAPLFQDPDVVQAWIDRWWELRGGVLSDSNLNTVADSMGAQIGNAAGTRDAAKWPDNEATGGIYLNEIAVMKTWLTSTNEAGLGRTNWLDSQMPSPPTASVPSGVVAPGTSVTLGGSSVVRYFTNGQDPRPAGGGTTTAAVTYAGPLTINSTTVLRARRQGNFTPFPKAIGTKWSGPLLRVYLVNEVFAAASDLAVSEISYDPSAPTTAEKTAVPEVAAGDFEFIELRNVGSRTVNTFEIKLVEGAPAKAITLSPLTLAPGEAALVVKNREAFTARYGTTLNARIVGEWGDGSLSNDGEEIKILARDGTTVFNETYGPIATGGLSLNRLGTGWKTDVPSPGTAGPTYAMWKSFYFPAAGADSGDTSDPDLDGVENRAEYGRRTNPKGAEDPAAYLPTFTLANDGTGENYLFTYKRAMDRPSAEYKAEKSSDMVIWTTAESTLVSTVQGIETRVVTVPTAGNAPKRMFLRQRVIVTP